MHQISLQQLSKHLPKPIQKWDNQDICKWLTLNQIDAQYQKIRKDGINGRNALTMKSYDWINLYGVSKFIGRQIAEWLEEQSEQFNLIVNRNRNAQGNSNQILNNSLNLVKKSVDNIITTSEQNLIEYHKQNRKIIQRNRYQNKSQPKKQLTFNQNDHLALKILPKSKSSQYIQQAIVQSKSLQQQQERQRKSIQGEEALSIQQQQDQEIMKQIQSLKSQQGQQQHDNLCNIRKLSQNNQITERVQTKQKNNTKIIKEDFEKQRQIYENQSMNVAKWLKKKKQDTKTLNQKVKGKKDVKQTKLYNYINANNSELNQNKGGLPKRVSSAQQIANAYKLNNLQKPDNIPAVQPKPKNGLPQIKLQSPYVKFANSQFIPYTPQGGNKNFSIFQKKIKIVSSNDSQQYVINGNAKIGRFKTNQVVLVDESVSRVHAEIVPEISMNGQVKYYLKDIGSRFGTFLECRGIQQNIQGKSYLIGDAEIQIVSVEPNKQTSSSINKNKPTFDLKVKIDRQKQLTLTNRSIVNIGKGSGNQIRIQNNCQNAKVWMERDKRICLQAVQGKLFMKLKQHQLYDIQAYVNSQKKLQIVFGWLKTTLQVIQICMNCGDSPMNCPCNNTTISKNNT